MKIKKEPLILIAIFIAGLVIRLYLFYEETFIGNDAVALARLGKNLVETGRYSFGENYNWGFFFPPGVSVLIGVVNLFIKDLLISGKLVSLFASLANIFLFYLIGKELHSKETGLFSAFIFAFHPIMLGTQVSSVRVATEPLFFCLLFLSIYLFFVLIRVNNFFVFALLGVSIGISYLTRPEGIFLLILPFLSFNSCNLLQKKKYLLGIAITVIAFFLTASPYLLFLEDATDKFTLSGKGSY